MSVGRPRWTSPPTSSIVCRTWDARSTSASPDPGRGWGQCGPTPEPCTTLPGALSVVVGAHDGRPTAALGIVSSAGPAWYSLRGGRIDTRIELDASLKRSAEGGLALDAAARELEVLALLAEGAS